MIPWFMLESIVETCLDVSACTKLEGPPPCPIGFRV